MRVSVAALALAVGCPLPGLPRPRGVAATEPPTDSLEPSGCDGGGSVNNGLQMPPPQSTPWSRLLPNEVRWVAAVPPRHVSGQPHPWYTGDPLVQNMTRRHDDPAVIAARQRVITHGCLDDLETISATSPDFGHAAARLFRRDGFVVVTDVLTQEQVEALQRATAEILKSIFQADPNGEVGGGSGDLPHRYSLGVCSATRHNFHVPAFAQLIDLPTTTPVLTAIFANRSDYVVAGAGGDVCLGGAVEYQALHVDNIWGDFPGAIQEFPPPIVTINFAIQDIDAVNGPIRQIRGTQHSFKPLPTLEDEPLWMKHSTVCPMPAGAAIFRDNRAWHGGTPNLGPSLRALPNLEFFAPWFRSAYLTRTMPREVWEALSPHGRHAAREVVREDRGVSSGQGYYSPRGEDRHRAVQGAPG